MEEEIISVINASSQVGFITSNPGGSDKYRLRVYTLGSKSAVIDTTFSYDYESVRESGGEYLFTAGASCMILNSKGDVIFQKQMEAQVNYLFGLGQNGRYLMITDSELQIIKLTSN